MSAADEILKQRRAELAQKFLRRSLNEARLCGARLAAASAEEPLQGAAELKMFAHKITGTGATLGLEAVSEVAREFETALSPPAGGGPVAALDLDGLRSTAARLLAEIERHLA